MNQSQDQFRNQKRYCTTTLSDRVNIPVWYLVTFTCNIKKKNCIIHTLSVKHMYSKQAFIVFQLFLVLT